MQRWFTDVDVKVWDPFEHGYSTLFGEQIRAMRRRFGLKPADPENPGVEKGNRSVLHRVEKCGLVWVHVDRFTWLLIEGEGKECRPFVTVDLRVFEVRLGRRRGVILFAGQLVLHFPLNYPGSPPQLALCAHNDWWNTCSYRRGGHQDLKCAYLCVFSGGNGWSGENTVCRAVEGAAGWIAANKQNLEARFEGVSNAALPG